MGVRRNGEGHNVSKHERSLILVVDDIADDRFITRMNLERNDFSVTEAGNWEDAIKEIREEDPALVVLDINMTRLDGIKLLEMIRKDNGHKDIPVILYTSTPFSPEKEKEYEDKGADSIVRKSDHPSTLIERIKALLRIDLPKPNQWYSERAAIR
jgi:CheY-like chemotaxis protein